MFITPEEIFGGTALLDTPIRTYELPNSAPLALDEELSIELEGVESKNIYLDNIMFRYQHTVDNLLLLEKILYHSQGTVSVEVVGASILVTGPEGYLNQFCDGDEGVLIVPE